MTTKTQTLFSKLGTAVEINGVTIPASGLFELTEKDQERLTEHPQFREHFEKGFISMPHDAGADAQVQIAAQEADEARAQQEEKALAERHAAQESDEKKQSADRIAAAEKTTTKQRR